jgi:hypothetical protein
LTLLEEPIRPSSRPDCWDTDSVDASPWTPVGDGRLRRHPQRVPFDFSAYTFPWAIGARIVLAIAIVGSGISVLVNIYRLIHGPRSQRPPTAATP